MITLVYIQLAWWDHADTRFIRGGSRYGPIWPRPPSFDSWIMQIQPILGLLYQSISPQFWHSGPSFCKSWIRSCLLLSSFNVCCTGRVQFNFSLPIVSTLKVCSYHRYKREISEPVPFLSQAWAQFGGLWVFPIIKITVVCWVRMSPASTAVWAWRLTCVKCCTVCKDCGRICFGFVFVCG